MFWQDDSDQDNGPVTDRVVDMVFSIDCRELPVDHAFVLSAAVLNTVPGSRELSGVAVHTVHVAGSQNGWERPEHGPGQRLILSRRTKLTIRVPGAQQEEFRRHLEGATLDVDGCRLIVGKAMPRPLSKQSTLLARHVVMADKADENAFLQWVAGELEPMGIRIRKALCGKTLPLQTPDGPVMTRSLMLANLSVEESIRLQERGLGSHRHMGCGVFIPHKGIDAVKKGND